MKNKIIRSLLYPPLPLLPFLLVLSGCLLPYTMLSFTETHPLRIAAYVLSAYTLTLWCLRVPDIIRFFKRIKNEHKYAQLYFSNARIRISLSLTFSFVWNTAYATMQLTLGIHHRSFWFYSLAGYYFCLAVMRYFLMRHTIKYKPGEKMREELILYRCCGWTFFAINVALSVMIFCMVFLGKTVHHGEIMTIAIAAYTFAIMASSIVNIVRYRKYNSPVFSASKALSLTSACVSMLNLEATMLNTFSGEKLSDGVRKLFLGISGGAAVILIMTMAVYMIIKSTKKIKTTEK